MKLGINSRSLPNGMEQAPTAVLEQVAALGLDGCQFPSPFALSPDLDPAQLREARTCAEAHGLYVEVTLGQINAYRFDSRPEVLALGDGDMRVGLQRLIEAARAVDCTQIMFSVGSIADRFSPSVAWAEQLRATTAFLRPLAPLLRDLGCQLCLKTHEEITSFEVVRVVDALGQDVLGVCFDPVNVLVRIEDPLSAARRLEPYIHQLHVDDALLVMTPEGLERWLVPCGSGIVDWPTLLPLVVPRLPDARVNIELHRAFFDMAIFDATWLAAQPDLNMTELVSVLRLVSESTTRPLVKDFQTDPGSRLQPTLAYFGVGQPGSSTG